MTSIKWLGSSQMPRHETAKRYYDRHTKLEQLRKNNFVCVHDRTHKRSKARKFS